jgi:CBS domain-containing protein
MTVAHILAKKGRNVVTTRQERTLHEVSVELTRQGIGALVVVDANDNIIGIISERDIVAAIGNQGVHILADTVAQHMTRDPKVASEGDSIDSMMDTMTNQRFRHLPIVDGGRLTGLVSIGDVVKHRIEEIESERKALRDYIANA